MQENGIDTSLFYKLANALTGFIYSFHMPVFIALSGCLFALKRYDLRSLVSKKFKRLLIPFFVVWLAWKLPIKYFTGYYDNVSVSGMFLQMIFPSCVYLWYLECLFFVFLLAQFITRFKTTVQLILIACCWLVGVALYKKFSDYHFLGDPVYYVVWFYLGYRERDVIALCKKFKLWNTATALVLPLLLLCIFCIGHMIEIKGLSTLLNFILGPLFMFVSLSYFSRLFTKHSSKYLKTSSDYGLGVYLYAEPINYLLLYIFFEKCGIAFFGEESGAATIYFSRIIVSTVIAIVITYFLRKFNINYLH